MARGQCSDHLLSAQQQLLHRGIVKPYAPKSNVDAAFLERRNLLERGQLDQLDFDAGTRRAIAPDNIGQPTVEGRGDKANANPEPRRVLQPACERLDLLDAPEYLQGLLVQYLTCLGEAHWAAPALDQPDTELFLELLDLPAQRRLRDAQRLCRAGEVPLARNGREVTELPQFQAIPPEYGSNQLSLRSRKIKVAMRLLAVC